MSNDQIMALIDRALTQKQTIGKVILLRWIEGAFISNRWFAKEIKNIRISGDALTNFRLTARVAELFKKIYGNLGEPTRKTSKMDDE